MYCATTDDIDVPYFQQGKFHDTKEEHDISSFIEQVLDDTCIFINDIQSIIIRFLLPVFDLRCKKLYQCLNSSQITIIGDICEEYKKFVLNIDKYRSLFSFFNDSTSHFLWINAHDIVKRPYFYFYDGCIICDTRLLFNINLSESRLCCFPFRFRVRKINHRKNHCVVTTDSAIFKIDDNSFIYEFNKKIQIRDDFLYRKIKLFKEEYYQLFHKRKRNFSYGHQNTAKLLLDYYEKRDHNHIKKIRDTCIYL